MKIFCTSCKREFELADDYKDNFAQCPNCPRVIFGIKHAVVREEAEPAPRRAQTESKPAVSAGSCPKCGTQLQQQMKFCFSCGASTESPPSAPAAAVETPLLTITPAPRDFWFYLRSGLFDLVILIVIIAIIVAIAIPDSWDRLLEPWDTGWAYAKNIFRILGYTVCGILTLGAIIITVETLTTRGRVAAQEYRIFAARLEIVDVAKNEVKTSIRYSDILELKRSQDEREKKLDIGDMQVRYQTWKTAPGADAPREPDMTMSVSLEEIPDFNANAKRIEEIIAASKAG